MPRWDCAWSVAIWHVAYLGGLAAALAGALWEGRGRLGPSHALLAAVVLAQGALYARVFLRAPRWPLPLRQALAYLAGSVALWALAHRLALGAFAWVPWALSGQMLGVLPPWASVPLGLLVHAVALLTAGGWRGLPALDADQWARWAIPVCLWLVLGVQAFQLRAAGRERARLVDQLQAALAELAEARRRDVELAALRERERVARDLHDGLGHTLAALSVQLEAIQRLYPVDPARAAALLEDLKALVRASMAELRCALAGLRSPGLGDRPLDQALAALAQEVASRTGLEVACAVHGSGRRLPPAVAEALWRVASEALANVARHAGATRARVELAFRPGAVTLTVADNGRGFPDGGAAPPGHYGLQGMRERVEGLGGILTLGRAPEGGALVQATVPLIGQEVAPAGPEEPVAGQEVPLARGDGT